MQEQDGFKRKIEGLVHIWQKCTNNFKNVNNISED